MIRPASAAAPHQRLSERSLLDTREPSATRPLASARAPAARPAPRPNQGTTAAPSLSILVIDENRARAAIIEAGLREAGHDRVTLVHSLAGIARRVEETAPDVIVIDLESPGRDMLEHMFQLSRAVRRPVAMFVDRSDSDSIARAVEAGVSAY